MFSLKFSDFWIDSISQQVFIMLKIVVSWIVMPERRSITLFESCVLLGKSSSNLTVSGEVELWEETIVRNHVVSWVRLVVIKVGEWGHVLSSKIKWNEWVSIINCIKFFAMKVSQDIMFNDACLSVCSINWSSCWSIGASSKSENILIFCWLQSIGININKSIWISQSSINRNLVRSIWGMDNKLIEILLNRFTSINISKSSEFLALWVLLYFQQLPTEIDFNVSLSAFIQSHFISIVKVENCFVWSPVLNSCSSWSSF